MNYFLVFVCGHGRSFDGSVHVWFRRGRTVNRKTSGIRTVKCELGSGAGL